MTINANRILLNLGNDDGGGIRALDFNGQDVASSPLWTDWHLLQITNNVIVNNVSADYGAGISLDDAVRVVILNNTIAYNNSVATNEDSFANLLGAVANPPGALSRSTPMPSGLAAKVHSRTLQAVLPSSALQGGSHPRPILYNNILVGNRSYYFDDSGDPLGDVIPVDGPQSTFSVPADQPDYFNLGIVKGSGKERFEPEVKIIRRVGRHLSAQRKRPLCHPI